MNSSTYHVSPFRRWIMVLMFAPVFVGLFFLGLEEPGPAIATGLVILPFALLGHWAVSYARLEIGPEGISLRQLGFKMNSSWDNIESFYSEKRHEGFFTKKPMTGKGVDRMRKMRYIAMRGVSFYDDQQQRGLGQGQFIPIEAFAYWLRKGDFLQTMAQWAPDIARQAQDSLSDQ